MNVRDVSDSKVFTITTEDGSVAKIYIYITTHYNVTIRAYVKTPKGTFGGELRKSISRSTGKLYFCNGHINDLHFAIPEDKRDEVCDYLEQMKRVSQYMIQVHRNKLYSK